MSHKVEIKTELNNKTYLLKALEKMGFTYQEAAENEQLTTKGRYNVNEKVDILITGCENQGSYVADVGFKKNTDGTYTAVGDFWNMRDANGMQISAESLKCDVTAYSKEEEVNERLSALMFQMDEGSRKDTKEKLSFTYQRWVA